MGLSAVELGMGIPAAILATIAAIFSVKQQMLFNLRRKQRHQSYVKRHPIAHIGFCTLAMATLVTTRVIDGPWLKETRENNEMVAFFVRFFINSSSVGSMLLLLYRVYLSMYDALYYHAMRDKGWKVLINPITC